MLDEPPSYQDTLLPYLSDELRVLNAHLPRNRVPLYQLLQQEHPHVTCNDGSRHILKRKELEYLSELLEIEEQKSLLLPMILEAIDDQSKIQILSEKGIEAKIMSAILDMPVKYENNRVTIFRPQLNMVRKVLKTTTQYAFSHGITG